MDDNQYTLLGKRAQTARSVCSAPSIPLYALRHTVVTHHMTEARIPEWLRVSIVVHESRSVIDKRYMKSESQQLMSSAIDSINYGEAINTVLLTVTY